MNPNGDKRPTNSSFIFMDGSKVSFISQANKKKEARGFFKTYEDIVRAWTEPRNGYGDSIWVDSKIIEDLRKN